MADAWDAMGAVKTQGVENSTGDLAVDADNDLSPVPRVIYVNKACTLHLILKNADDADVRPWVFPAAGFYAVRFRRLVRNPDAAIVRGCQ